MLSDCVRTLWAVVSVACVGVYDVGLGESGAESEDVACGDGSEDGVASWAGVESGVDAGESPGVAPGVALGVESGLLTGVESVAEGVSAEGGGSNGDGV
jgi:hypothetical protein